jgi:PAS domain S-box-containing protein
MAEANNEARSPRPMSSALGAMLRASDGILDLLPIATFICDANGVILQYNSRAVEIWGRAPRPGQTHENFNEGARYCELDGTPTERSLLADVLASGIAVRDVERIVERVDGTTVIASISIDPLRNAKGDVIGAVHCFTDITDRKRMDAALEESRRRALEREQLLAATYEHAAIGISEVAPDGRFLRVNEAICSIIGMSREQHLTVKLFDRTHPDDADPDREAFRKQVNGELEFYSIEKRLVRTDGRTVWISVRSTPVRADNGQLLFVVRVVQDITERKASERRQKLLIDELNHRVKNTLATVQSLASQTARGAPTPEAFREAFEGRLIALSKAHDQLTVHHWESVDLRELLSGSLAPYAGAGPDRIVLRGEDIVLRPRAVLTLAMVFHELATNAAKYGALSVPGGSIEIRWQPEPAQGGGEAGGKKSDPGGDVRMLRIEWIEQGGPPVVEPTRRGFGSKLIEGSIPADHGGSVRLVYDRSGLRCEIVVPLDAVAADSEHAPVGVDWSV